MYNTVEGLKTIRNLVDISLLIIDQDEERLLPTALETMFEEAQKVVFPYCVKEDSNA